MNKDNSNLSGKPNLEFQKAAMDALVSLKAVEAMKQLRSLGKRSVSGELRQMTEDTNKKIRDTARLDFSPMAEQIIKGQLEGQMTR